MSRSLIDLRKGHPAARHLPHARLAKASLGAATRLTRASEAEFPLNYCSDPMGTRRFRRSLGKYLSGAYGAPVSSRWLLTTNGVSHGLDLATAALTSPGDTVIVEDPTYFLVHGIFRDHRLSIESIRGGKGGLDVDALERRCADHTKPTPKLLYLVPTHGNPSGASVSVEARKKLGSLANTHGFYILADEVYQLLDWTAGGASPRLLTYDAQYMRFAHSRSTGDASDADAAADRDDDIAAYTSAGAASGAEADDGARVLSVSSFTKILSPALRLGWIEAAPSLLKRIAARGYLISGGGVAPYVSEVVSELLESGEQAAHVAELCARYKASCSALCHAMREKNRTRGRQMFDFVEPTGGYFCWVRIDGYDGGSDALLAAAERNGVSFLPGHRCMLDGKTLGTCARLCFAYEETEHMPEAVKRLAGSVLTGGTTLDF